MARYIDDEVLMQKLSRMIDYCEKNKDKKFNALDVLFQVGDAIMDCPTADVVPKSEVERLEQLLDSNCDKCVCEVAREIFEEIEVEIQEALNSNYRARPHIAESEELYHIVDGKITALSGIQDFIAELRKKYTEGE